jgi:hypothetical protein
LGAEVENSGDGGKVGECWEKKKDGLARADARVLPRTKEVAACNNSRILEEGMAEGESL